MQRPNKGRVAGTWVALSLCFLASCAGGKRALEPVSCTPSTPPSPCQASEEPPPLPCAPRAARPVAPRTGSARPSLAETRARIFEGANLDLAAEVLRRAEAQGRVVQAGLSPNPYVLFRKRRIRDFELLDTGFAELEVGQPFELGGKRQARVAEAQAQAAQVSEEVRGRVAETLREAELRYYRVLRLQHDLAQAREEQEATKELEGLVRTRFDSGKDSRFASLRLEAQSRDADLKVQDLDHQQGVACRSLDEVLGYPAGTVGGVVGEWTSATLSSVDRRAAQLALQRHPRRRAADRAVEAACRGIRRADADVWPDLTVGLAAEHDSDSGRDYVGLVLHSPIPLWNRNEGARVEAHAAALRARRLQESQILKLETELEAAWLAYEKSTNNAAGYASEIIPRLVTSLQLARQAYSAGRTSYLDVLDALIALIRARRSRIAHLENQARAAAEVRYLTGS